MSQVFEGYERQYCELSANLTKKCSSASILDGGEKDIAIFSFFYEKMLLYLPQKGKNAFLFSSEEFLFFIFILYNVGLRGT